jgi:signal transduction histidine kinase/CheY-like chemotaxis protein
MIDPHSRFQLGDHKQPVNQRLFHHVFAIIGTLFFCMIALMLHKEGHLELSYENTIILLVIFFVVNMVFTAVFFIPISEGIKREYIVLLHMLWGQISLLTLGFYSAAFLEVSMMLSLATFVFVSFGVASYKLFISVILVTLGYGWIIIYKLGANTADTNLILFLAYMMSAIFIAFINAYAGDLQLFLTSQNSLIRQRTRELEESQKQLLAAKETAEAVSQSKTRFLAAASHDLRQPLHALVLYIGALQLEKNTDARARLLSQMEKASHELNALLNSLFDISRFDNDVVEVSMQPVKLQEVIEDLALEFSDLAHRLNRPLQIRSCDAWVAADLLLLHRILRGLVSNALKHSQKGRVLLGFRYKPEQVRCEVWDSGVGIAPVDQAKIFEEFYQVENSNRNRAHGLGLGLALIKRMCISMNYPFGLHSWPGKGSVFWFEMPRAQQAQGLQNAPLPDILTSRLQDKTVICIDDEPAILDGMRDLLENWGCYVICATSGERALKLMQMSNANVDVILCDYRLSQLENGIQVICMLRQTLAVAVPAILITGDMESSLAKQAQMNGIELLEKPIHALKLQGLMEKVMGLDVIDAAY